MTDEEPTLLQTIKIPKNLLVLSDKLPNANYGKLMGKESKSSLPEIPTKTSTDHRKTDQSIKVPEKYTSTEAAKKVEKVKYKSNRLKPQNRVEKVVMEPKPLIANKYIG